MSLWKAIVGKTEVAPLYRSPRIDSSTNSFQFVDYAHHEIHEGDAFMHSHRSASATSINVYLKTPDTDEHLHMIVIANVAGQYTLEVLEAPTVTSPSGTSSTPYNRNRNSATTPTSIDNAASSAAGKVSVDVTGISGGTTIFIGEFGTGSKSGGEVRSDAEIILKKNTAYVFRTTTAPAASSSIILSWYQHTAEIGD